MTKKANVIIPTVCAHNLVWQGNANSECLIYMNAKMTFWFTRESERKKNYDNCDLANHSTNSQINRDKCYQLF